MPSSKTPQKALNEAIDEISAVFEGYTLGRTGVAERVHPEIKDEFALTLRSSMQSLLLHVMGEMPKKNQRIATNGIDPDKGEIRDCLSAGYNSAITDCLAVIQSTIDSIKK